MIGQISNTEGRVLGIDLSEKMIRVSLVQNADMALIRSLEIYSFLCKSNELKGDVDG